MIQPLTITELNAYLRDLLESDARLQDVLVEGELSGFTRAASGHLYFTLKDAQAELRGVMWKTAAGRLRFEPQQGDRLLAHGFITYYEARGQVQIVCDLLLPAGAGDLNRQFELLKARLAAEGLFDEDRKRPIPAFPRRIGVVTSPTAAAFQDVQNVLRRRYPVAEVIFSPTLVQGPEAPPQIVAALARLNDHSDADVILLVRGGGSLEDLWCFNDEAVVRAVAESRIPVVSGVGHEIDFTLVDFAADLRAPTPSAAAELVTPDGAHLRARISAWAAEMGDALAAEIERRRAALRDQQRWLARAAPGRAIQTQRQRIDELLARAGLRVAHGLSRRRDRLVAQVHALEAANPSALLQRGYAIVMRAADGGRLRGAADATEGEALVIALHDGRLGVTVTARQIDAGG